MKKLNYKIIIAMIILFIAILPNFSNAAKVSVGKVQNLKVTSVETTSVSYKWNKVKNATKYQVYIYNYDKNKYEYYGETAKTNIKITKRQSARVCKVRVRAYIKKGRKKYYGNYSSACIIGTKPEKVKNITIKSQTDKTLSISWSKSPRATGYTVYVLNPKTNKFEDKGSTKSNSITIKNLQQSMTYKVKVRAYKEADKKKTYGEFSPTVSTFTLVSAVKNLKIKENNADNITIGWDKLDRASGYTVYRYNASKKNWEIYATTKNTYLKLAKNGLKEDDLFKVNAFATLNNKTYNGGFSNTLSTIIYPDRVTGLKVTKTTDTSIDVSWNKVNGANGYAVYVYRESGQAFKQYNVTTGTTMKITNLSAAKFYKIYVKAYTTINSKNYYGKDSDTISQKTKSTSKAIAGIDVSSHQTNIDWNAVKKAGVDFAIIRCGYGKDDQKQDDKYFNKNVAECERLGIPYGVYIYSYALDTKGADSEADHALRLLKGHNPKYGVWFDMEDADGYKKKNGMPSNETLINICVTFCDKLIKNGYDTGIYASLSWFNNQLKSSKLDKYTKWVAHWSDNCGYKSPYKMWQYSSSGIVDGISGNVDLDVIYFEK